MHSYMNNRARELFVYFVGNMGILAIVLISGEYFWGGFLSIVSVLTALVLFKSLRDLVLNTIDRVQASTASVKTMPLWIVGLIMIGLFLFVGLVK